MTALVGAASAEKPLPRRGRRRLSGVPRKPEDALASSALDSWARSAAMLRAVLAGESIGVAAARAGICRTAAERRIKHLAARLLQSGQVAGMRAEGTAHLVRLREHRTELLAALDLGPPSTMATERVARVLTPAEVAVGAQCVRARSLRHEHDLALYHLVFATGLRPLEVARLQVDDYLTESGQVRRQSVLRAEAAINGKARPLCFVHRPLDEALGAYLALRLRAGHGLGSSPGWRGLDPASPLFLGQRGKPYAVTLNGTGAGERFICRMLLEAFKRVFRHSGIAGMCGQTARLTLMARMYERGADEDQVGLVLGIADRRTVREQLPRPRPTLIQVLTQADSEDGS